jgi:hypothetical protein
VLVLPKSNTFNALLTAGANCIIGANGTGIALTGPTGIGSNWYPIQVAVTCNSPITPIGNLYLGPSLPVKSIAGILSDGILQQIGYTNTANGDSIGFVSNLAVPYGQALVFQWIGAQEGSQGSLLVTGTQSATYWR